MHSWAAACGLVLWGGGVFAAEPQHPIDAVLARENVGRNVRSTPPVDDLAFLRRISVDLIGRIPTEPEIQAYLKLPSAERREKTIDRLMEDSRFVDRWTVFFADQLRIRTNADGGGALLAYVHQSVAKNRPYDEMVKALLIAHGKAGKTPELGFILGDNAEPMALAGVTSQVLLGVRISCAECHDHPFDVWKRKQFYGFAAYFGKTKRLESNLTKAVYTIEEERNVILWPPEGEAEAADRKPMPPTFPFALDAGDGQNRHIARLTALRTRIASAAAGAKSTETSVDDLLAEAGEKAAKQTGAGTPDPLDVSAESRNAARALKADEQSYSALRAELAALIVDPRNRQFSRNLVNRVWAELLGRGFVEPIDDFSEGNPPSHPATLDLLADEFVAGGYDFRNLVRLIVTTRAYRQSPLVGADEPTRQAAEEAFVAMPVRRMLSEALFDSIVHAGHLTDFKHPAGSNLKEDWRYDRVGLPKKTATQQPQVASIVGKPAANMPAGGANMPAAGGGNMPAAGGAMAGGAMKGPGAAPAKGYDLEGAIEVDFAAALQEQPEIQVEMMRKMSNEELEALEVARQAGMKYLDRYIRIAYDDNPKFTAAVRMAGPANPEHFLRVFGQTDRVTPGEHRDHSASMRQALMMLNGRLTHEAARVGSLEPIHALLIGPKKNFEAAVRLAYREILTREPDAEELRDNVKDLQASASPTDTLADLRWVLLNCHEFRFLP